MSKSLLTYFKSENDAESARSSLQRLRVTDVYVEEMPDEGGMNMNMYIPLFAVGSTSSSMGAVGELDEGGIAANEIMRDKDTPVTHVLEGQVEEADFEKAKEILRDNRGFSRQD